MEQNSIHPNRDCIWVCAPARRAMIHNQIGPEHSATRHAWHSNVYSALADAVLVQRQRRPALVCILVDHLTPAEMTVFDCLTQLDGITTLAFSTRPTSSKLTTAQRQGAAWAVPGDQLTTTLRAALNEPEQLSPGTYSDQHPIEDSDPDAAATGRLLAALTEPAPREEQPSQPPPQPAGPRPTQRHMPPQLDPHLGPTKRSINLSDQTPQTKTRRPTHRRPVGLTKEELDALLS